MADEVAGADGRGPAAVEDGAERGADVDGAECTFVVGDAGCQDGHQGIGGVSLGVVQDDVDAAVDLWGRAGVVDPQFISGDRERAGDGQGRVKAIDGDGVAVGAIGKGANRAADSLFRTVEDERRDRFDIGQVDFVEHFDQLAGADLIADFLGVDIADDLIGNTDVGADDIEEFAIWFAGFEELHQRDRQAFFVEGAGIAAHGCAADVNRVAGAREEGDATPTIEDG